MTPSLTPIPPLLSCDETSQMTLFDGSWLDGRVRILEPAAADAVATVPVSLPGASPGAPAAASLCYLQHAELLLASFEGASIVIAADATDGALKAELGGHVGGAPLLKYLPQVALVASGGRDETDGTIRLWKVERVAASEAVPLSQRSIDVKCDRVLTGHTGPLTAMTYLPDAALLVSAAADCTIRFWDATATPIPLTAPEGGSHVRLAPGVFGPMRPEWTSTNPKYVNCHDEH